MSIVTEIERLQTAKKDIKSAIEEKGVTVGDGNIDTYAEKIGEITAGGGDAQMLIDNMAIRDFIWQNVAFPEGYELVLNFKKTNGNNNTHSLNAVLYGTTGIKTVTLICEESGTIMMGQFVRASSVEVVDITNFKRIPTEISYMAMANTKLVSILGELDMSSCTKANGSFNGTTALKDIAFKKETISIALSFANCSLLSDTSIQSIIDGLADLTGGTAQKLELHSTTTANLTPEQILQIAEKNWTTE